MSMSNMHTHYDELILSIFNIFLKIRKYFHMSDSSLFSHIMQRIYLILKSNYLHEFYQKMMQIPTKIYKKQSYEEGLRFNSCGSDI